MKGPAYVMTALTGLRAWVDAIRAGRADEAAGELAEHLADMQLAYSLGLADDFLGGADHQHLVNGRFPKHRGLFLGLVVERRGDHLNRAWLERRARAAAVETEPSRSYPLTKAATQSPGELKTQRQGVYFPRTSR